MRLFVAIDLPDSVKALLEEAASPLREAGLPVRWADRSALHLTLKFLGEVRPEAVAEVERAAATAAAKTEPFEAAVRGVGAFPSLRRPRVIWAGVEAVPGLRCLKHDLEWEFKELGFEREVRAFQPHITLGRVAPDAQAGEFRGFSELASGLTLEAELAADEVVLMRSHLSPRGARYEVLRALPLGRGSRAALG